MQQRGLRIPLLIISDDAPGLRKAIKECFPDSFYQICQVHKMHNILCKIPRDMQKELIAKFKDRIPSAMECLEKALPQVITRLTLFYATLIDSSKRWYGVRMSIDIMQELDKLWKKVTSEKNNSGLSVVTKESPLEDQVLVGH